FELLQSHFLERDRPVVALQPQRTERRLGPVEAAARGIHDLDVLLDELAVQLHPLELRVRDLPARSVDAPPRDAAVEAPPLARRVARVALGRAAGEAAVAVHPLVDAAAVARADVLLAEAVEDLQLVAAHEVDAAVASLRDAEVDARVAVA